MKRPSCNNAITIITSPRTDNNSTSEKYPQVQTQHQSNTMSLRRVSLEYGLRHCYVGLGYDVMFTVYST